MVKVFRGFRRKWIQDGQVRKYFLYAIGEIFLVVVGILIALSINNWNNEKELRKAEKQIYKNLLQKINKDKIDILGNVDYNNIRIALFQTADSIISTNDRSKIDELKVILYKLFEYSDYSGSDDIYQNLVNSGELRLLKNEDIIAELQELEELYIFINRLETNHWQFILRFVGPDLIDNVHMTDLKAERPDELYTFRFQNLLIGMIGIMDEKDGVYQAIIDQIETVSKLIHEELNN